MYEFLRLSDPSQRTEDDVGAMEGGEGGWDGAGGGVNHKFG